MIISTPPPTPMTKTRISIEFCTRFYKNKLLAHQRNNENDFFEWIFSLATLSCSSIATHRYSQYSYDSKFVHGVGVVDVVFISLFTTAVRHTAEQIELIFESLFLCVAHWTREYVQAPNKWHYLLLTWLVQYTITCLHTVGLYRKNDISQTTRTKKCAFTNNNKTTVVSLINGLSELGYPTNEHDTSNCWKLLIINYHL